VVDHQLQVLQVRLFQKLLYNLERMGKIYNTITEVIYSFYYSDSISKLIGRNPNDLDIEITVANGSAWISKVSSNLEVKDQDGTVSDDSVRSSYVLSASTHQQLELNLTIPKTTSV